MTALVAAPELEALKGFVGKCVSQEKIVCEHTRLGHSHQQGNRGGKMGETLRILG
jgi:hypothetical protein